jgi:hypothetical protein
VHVIDCPTPQYNSMPESIIESVRCLGCSVIVSLSFYYCIRRKSIGISLDIKISFG